EPAESGALDYATTFATTHPGHMVLVVLATDGEPDQCGSTVASVSAVAAAGRGATPAAPAYAIRGGRAPPSLNQIAAAGGSKQAFMVDTALDVKQQFLDQLKAIYGAASLPCTYTIPSPPAGGQLDFTRFNVAFIPNGGSRDLLLQTS